MKQVLQIIDKNEFTFNVNYIYKNRTSLAKLFYPDDIIVRGNIETDKFLSDHRVSSMVKELEKWLGDGFMKKIIKPRTDYTIPDYNTNVVDNLVINAIATTPIRRDEFSEYHKHLVETTPVLKTLYDAFHLGYDVIFIQHDLDDVRINDYNFTKDIANLANISTMSCLKQLSNTEQSLYYNRFPDKLMENIDNIDVNTIRNSFIHGYNYDWKRLFRTLYNDVLTKQIIDTIYYLNYDKCVYKNLVAIMLNEQCEPCEPHSNYMLADKWIKTTFGEVNPNNDDLYNLEKGLYENLL